LGGTNSPVFVGKMEGRRRKINPRRRGTEGNLGDGRHGAVAKPAKGLERLRQFTDPGGVKGSRW